MARFSDELLAQLKQEISKTMQIGSAAVIEQRTYIVDRNDYRIVKEDKATKGVRVIDASSLPDIPLASCHLSYLHLLIIRHLIDGFEL